MHCCDPESPGDGHNITMSVELADEYVYGRIARVSREAPVLILDEATSSLDTERCRGRYTCF